MENDKVSNAEEDPKQNSDVLVAGDDEDAACSQVEDDDSPTTDIDKYKEAFDLLWPGANGTVHKDKLLEFFKSILGALYSEDMASCLIEIMKPDDEGNITMENFVHAFSLAYWTPESVAAMHNVLITNPDIISKLADWKDVLKNLGLEMTDSEVNAIIQQAQVRATALLSAELSKSSEYCVEDRDEVHRRSGEILNSIRTKLSGVNLNDLSGSGESITTEGAVVGVEGGTGHPESPKFPVVPDKLEADEQEKGVLKKVSDETEEANSGQMKTE